MSEHSEQREQPGRTGGSGCWLIAICMLLLYILSPPLVELACGPNVVESNVYLTVYAPLIFLADRVPPVREFYIWYYNLCGML